MMNMNTIKSAAELLDITVRLAQQSNSSCLFDPKNTQPQLFLPPLLEASSITLHIQAASLTAAPWASCVSPPVLTLISSQVPHSLQRV